ncbi:hypothetical protein Golob_012923 [Gossypium lobatum]|uniref:Uncharacterized protein n=1 Tax=Gossypium lobatum TaxID=34289 RepID=A0A7J8LMT7_9ROSI|nr:hypothetical protein [Gossypium lobatum]
MEDFIILIWNSWNNRNNFTFCGKEENAITIWNRALALNNDFRIYNLSEKPMIPIQPTVHRGKKPAQGDDDGFVLGGYGCVKETTINSDWVEIMAIVEDLNSTVRNASVCFDSSSGTSSPTPEFLVFIDDIFPLTGPRSLNTHSMWLVENGDWLEKNALKFLGVVFMKHSV